MKICICEDNKLEQHYLYKLLLQEVKLRNWDCSFSLFSCGADFLTSLDQADYDLVFMDIYLEDYSGIELSQKLREKEKEVPIIFTTNSTDYYKDGFQVGALHYLVKPIKPQDLNEALNRCSRFVDNASKMLTVTSKGIKRDISISQIIYIEVFNKCCNIHTNSEVIEVILPLKQLITSLDSSLFIQCHRSFCVNLAYISKIEHHNILVLNDGTELPIARDKKGDISKQFDLYKANC